MRADRAELFPREYNITRAHNAPEIDGLFYFPSVAGEKPDAGRAAARSRLSAPLCELSSSARKAAVFAASLGSAAALGDFAGSIALFTRRRTKGKGGLKSEARNHDVADVAIMNGRERIRAVYLEPPASTISTCRGNDTCTHFMRALNQHRLPIITLSRERGKLNTQFPAELRNENRYAGRESCVI